MYKPVYTNAKKSIKRKHDALEVQVENNERFCGYQTNTVRVGESINHPQKKASTIHTTENREQDILPHNDPVTR